jgi:hypothetical protein
LSNHVTDSGGAFDIESTSFLNMTR